MSGTEGEERDDPHLPLRRDIQLLGYLLGETLKEQEGASLLEKVEEVRILSRGIRAGREEAGALLEAVVGGMAPEEVAALAHAFAYALSLSDLAEQHHRDRRRREHRLAEAPPQRGSLAEVVERLLAAGVAAEQVWAQAAAQQVEVVLAASPVEPLRRTVLRQHGRITALLAARDRVEATPEEAEALLDALRREIAAGWATDGLRPAEEAASPLADVRGGLVYVEEVLWGALPAWLRTLDRGLAEATGRGLPLQAAPLRIGSRLGGDRDADPRVTAEVIEQAVQEGRAAAARLYRRELAALAEELPLRRGSSELYGQVGGAREPYRALLASLGARLAGMRDPAELLGPLLLCERSLRACGDDVLAEGRLTDVVRRAAAFGLSLVRLDVCLPAAAGVGALDALTRYLGLGAYSQWTEAERVGFLVRELGGRRPLIPAAFWQGASDALPPEVQGTLALFAAAAAQPPDSLGAWVVGHATRASDVLAFELLQREARQHAGAGAGAAPALRVVPRLEARAELAGGGRLLHDLLGVPWYRQRLRELHVDRQEVALGGAGLVREVGGLEAAWATWLAQEELTAVARRHGVAVTVTHEPEGAVPFGGAMMHRAIGALPPGAVDGALRVVAPIPQEGAAAALRSLELLATGVLEASLLPPAGPPPAWRSRLEGMAEQSRRAARRLLHGEDLLLPWLRATAPVAELGAPWGEAGGLRPEDWSFAWRQVRLLLPAWLGAEAVLEDDEAGSLRALARRWPLFGAILERLEAALCAAEADTSAWREGMLVEGDALRVGEELRARLLRVRASVARLREQAPPLQGNPVLARSLAVRSPHLDALDLLQASLLQRIRAEGGGEADPVLRDALRITARGIAAGCRGLG